jgi:intraflagellar transport protein 122
VACLGVTSKDWEILAMSALESQHLEIARKAFIRTREFKYLNLIAQFQVKKIFSLHDFTYILFGLIFIYLKKSKKDLKKLGAPKLDIFLGYMNAYQSKFNEAAKLFKKGGDENLAMTMFTDLRMFDQAKEYISGGDMDKTSILLKQAEWAVRNDDPKTAAELYMSSKQYNKAIELAGKNNWAEMLLEIVRKLDKADRESLSKCGEYFKRMNLHNFAAEVYEKMGNIKELIELRMESHQWEEVFALAKKYPDLNNLAQYKYGQWLAENDRFEEAQKGIAHENDRKEIIKLRSIFFFQILSFKLSTKLASRKRQ